MRIDTRTLAGTAILAALVVVFDYSMKYSSLKIVYPLLPQQKLKFDFTGVPIILSLYLFGFIPGVFTSVIALVAILARSGDVVASFMKAVAELSTVVGVAFALRVTPKFKRSASLVAGILTRCLVMFFANLLVLPAYYQTPLGVAVAISPLIALFNVGQGSISVLGGFFIYEAIRKRIPFLVQKSPRTV